MPGRTIPSATADALINRYYEYMTGLGVDMNNQTQSVSFSSGPFLAWLRESMADADELRIFMGAYEDERTTVILWPYKDGQPVVPAVATRGGDGPGDPFNEGSGQP